MSKTAFHVIRGVMYGWYIETGDPGEPYATASSAAVCIVRALGPAQVTRLGGAR